MELTLAPMSELEAINEMLSVIFESPVASLDEADGIVDAQMARQILHKVSREVQQDGWSFNRALNYKISPDNYGNINIPTNALSVDPSDDSLNYVFRDGKLYDMDNQTYDIDQDVYVDITYFLPFEELPSHARSYITTSAARILEQRTLTDSALAQVTAGAVLLAKSRFENDEAENTEANVVTGSPTVRNVVRRRRPR